MIRSVLVLLMMIAAVVSPAASHAASPQTGPIKIVTSFYPIYIMALNVAGHVPGVSVSNLTPPVIGCLHDYALTTDDMKKLADAQVFVANGAGMESFLGRILSQYPQIKVITLADGIPLLKGAGGEGDNPHVWVSLSNAITEVSNLGAGLRKADPVHADLYTRNTVAYIEKLEVLRQKMTTELAPYKGKSIITFHEAFPYFAQEFGFHIAAVVEREPGSEPSARELAETIEIILQGGIGEIFSEPQYPARAAETIANETGSRVYPLDPAVSGPDDPDAYLKIMEHNLEVLKHAFSQ